MFFKKTPKYYIVDGSESYVKESDIFDLKNSCVKLVVKSSKNEIKVVADDDMFSPAAIYTIRIDSGEILSEHRYLIDPQDILLKLKYNNLMTNLARDIVPSWAIDNRYNENEKSLDVKTI